jgi:WD40 repeat protein
MKIRPSAKFLLALVLALSGCSRAPDYAFPVVQKYSSDAGNLFYFKPGDGRFVMLERRRALAVAVAPQPNVQAYSFDDRITVSRPRGEMLENTKLVDSAVPQEVLAIAPNGLTLASGDAYGKVTLWDIATGNAEREIRVPSAVLSAAFSPDAEVLAIGLAKALARPTDTVWLWDIRTNALLRSFGRRDVTALAWSPDNIRIAAGHDDGSVLIAEAFGQLEPRQMRSSFAAVTALDFHPSGPFLVSAHTDKRVQLWKWPTGEVLHTLDPPLAPDPLFPRGIEHILFAPDGTRLAIAYADGEFRIHDVSVLVPPRKGQ